MPIRNPHPAYFELKRRRIHQSEMADALGYTRAYTCSVLAGDSPAPAPFRDAVAGYLDMPAGDLFHDDVTAWVNRVAVAIDAAPPAARGRAERLAALLAREAA